MKSVNWGRAWGKRRGLAMLGALFGVGLGTQAAEAELVEVATQAYSELSNGALQVTFANGRSVIVPSGDWTLIEDRVFIESSAISLAGASTETTATTAQAPGLVDGAVDLIADLDPLTLAGGSLALGYLLNSESSSGDDSDDSGDGIRASGTTLSGTISNETSAGVTDFSLDDANTVVIEDISGIFENASGKVTYAIAVTNENGTSASGLVYLDGTSLKIYSDPGADDNGIYTVTVTATDDYSTAQADVRVEVDVVSEVANKGSMADETKTLTPNSGTVVVQDLAQYFDETDGTLTYSATVLGADDDPTEGQLFNGVFSISGDRLILADDLTDTLIEQLNNDDSDEDIVLTVVITATDSADGTKKAQNSFDITLDASSVNDAPELKPGASNSYTIDKDQSGDTLGENEAIEPLVLSGYVTDDDDEYDDLSWSIDNNTDGVYSITDGELSGTSGNGRETISVYVDDGHSGTEPLEFRITIDVD